MKIGLYIHIPFCISKCHYCDFLSFADDKLQSQYTKTLIEEIKNYSKRLTALCTVKTIFIGGGTPTMLPPLLLDQICSAITDNFTLDPCVEWTLEGNPGTISKDIIQVINTHPINRISLGLQSTDSKLLKFLGRQHTVKDWIESISLLRTNTSCALNTDLIFAIPSQTFEGFKNTLQMVSSYHLEHLSIYGLIIEQDTKLWNWYQEGKFQLIDEVTDRKMYHYTKDYLKHMGYIQYEISNWARPTKECQHNILYWTRQPYIGIGLGAHSFFENIRYHNTSNIKHYIETNGEIAAITSGSEEIINREMAMQEFLFLGLRMSHGISPTYFKEVFHQDIFEVYPHQLNKWIELNILVKTKDNIFLSDYGMDICNEVFSSFL